jgi:hypothetical protein
MKYEIVRHFTGGFLKGLTITEITSVKFGIGFICNHPAGGSPYIIQSVKEIKT